MDWLLTKLSALPIDYISIETAIWLQFPPPITETDLLCATWLVGESLAYTWARRKNREDVSSASLHAILSTKAFHLSKTEKYADAGYQLCVILGTNAQ